MFIRPVTLLIASLLTPLSMRGQSLNQQPSLVQTPTSPCITTSTNPKQPSPSVALKPPSKWQQYLDAQKRTLASKYGVVLPDTPTQIALIPRPLPPPCPPPLAAVAPIAPKLPPDTTVTLHCNPMTPSSKDAAHPTTLTLPDPHDFAVPKLGDFEANSVVPDLAAKTPCYLVKVNPKTQKSFIQQ